jgi:hypothetical protein
MRFSELIFIGNEFMEVFSKIMRMIHNISQNLEVALEKPILKKLLFHFIPYK